MSCFSLASILAAVFCVSGFCLVLGCFVLFVCLFMVFDGRDTREEKLIEGFAAVVVGGVGGGVSGACCWCCRRRC